MTESAPRPEDDARRLRRCFTIAASFAAMLWLIKLVAIAFDLDLVAYGVYPRRASGLMGIVVAPLLHASLSHVFANTAPLIILGTTLLYGYPRSARIVIPAVYAGSGLGVWLFARSAYHVGASGLCFGMLFFIFTMGVLRWDKRAIALALVVSSLYGGMMLWGILPGDPRISFESHLVGATLGVILAALLKNHDPAPSRRPSGADFEESGAAGAREQDAQRWKSDRPLR